MSVCLISTTWVRCVYLFPLNTRDWRDKPAAVALEALAVAFDAFVPLAVDVPLLAALPAFGVAVVAVELLTALAAFAFWPVALVAAVAAETLPFAALAPFADFAFLGVPLVAGFATAVPFAFFPARSKISAMFCRGSASLSDILSTNSTGRALEETKVAEMARRVRMDVKFFMIAIGKNEQPAEGYMRYITERMSTAATVSEALEDFNQTCLFKK